MLSKYVLNLVTNDQISVAKSLIFGLYDLYNNMLQGEIIPSLSMIKIFVVTWEATSKRDRVLSKFSKLNLVSVHLGGPSRVPLIESCSHTFVSQQPIDFEGFFIVYISPK